MDRVVGIAGYQWRAYWRRFAGGGRFRSGSQGFSVIVAGILCFKYIQLLRRASSELAYERSALLELLLVGISCAWLIYFSTRDQNSDNSRRLLHFPFSLKELFVFRVICVLMPPYAWLLLGGSLAIAFPLRHAPRPLAGTIAAVLFIACSWLMGLTTAHLLGIPWCRRVLGATALVLSSVVGIFVVTNKGASVPPALSPWSPMRLVARAAFAANWSVAFEMLALLSVMTGLALVLACLSFRQSLRQSSANSSSRIRLQFSIPGRLGGLIVKDWKYFRRLLDVYLALLVAAAGCFYLITVDVASVDIVLMFLTVIFLPNSPFAFDCFGLDNASGMERYTLLPLSGRTILLSKNLAFLGFVGIQVAPLMALATWRLGLPAGIVCATAFVSLGCAYLAWGNGMSISHPVKLQFFRFSSSSSALFDAMAGIFFSSAPGVLIFYLLHSHPASLWTIASVPACFGALYFLSFTVFGRRFEQKLETLVRTLA